MESPLLHDGWTAVSTADLRNSTLSGTTHVGVNGSGQFLAVRLSTVNAGVAYLTTSSTVSGYGILQNKPGVGEVCDIGFLGISNAIAGTTTITAGGEVMPDSSGAMTPYTSAAGQIRFGKQVGAVVPTAVGQMFSVAIYGFGQGGGSVA